MCVCIDVVEINYFCLNYNSIPIFARLDLISTLASMASVVQVKKPFCTFVLSAPAFGPLCGIMIRRVLYRLFYDSLKRCEFEEYSQYSDVE